MSAHDSLAQPSINTIRTLAMDAVQAANSGHPGTPMALAPVAYTLWQRLEVARVGRHGRTCSLPARGERRARAPVSLVARRGRVGHGGLRRSSPVEAEHAGAEGDQDNADGGERLAKAGPGEGIMVISSRAARSHLPPAPLG